MVFSWFALYLSFKVAFCAVVINLLFAVPLGFFLARYWFYGREFVDTLFTLPMVMPPTVLGYYLLVILGRNGWIGSVLREYFHCTLVFTWQGAVVAATVVTFPLVFKPARVAFETINPCYEQAAQVLGLSDVSIFFRVTLPLAWKGILAGLLLSFSRALGEFGATLMIAGSIPGKTQTLSLVVYEAVQTGQDHVANLAVLVLSVVCVAVLLMAKYLNFHRTVLY